MAQDYSSFGLEGKVAIVTGPGHGIGKAIAVALAQAGADVVLASRTQAALEEVATEIRALGRSALVVPADVGKVADCTKIVAKTLEAYGKVDILINNAAWTSTKLAVDVTEEDWDKTVDTCLKGMFFLAQAAGKEMLKQGHGKIVNIGSTMGIIAFRERSVYATVKAGVHQLTRALALEWARDGVSVNGVGPCITETPTRRNLFERPGYKEWVTTEMLPIGRWAQPEDMVGATLFLCSSLSDMIVGETIMVDGGWTIH